ncbi:hypothetical protein SEVCU139_1499 [Staphylococcus lugdunensis VCU139]|nr:hypothetical protein SEVCU139_1499 [Staphylococcus lugdunensis VCU139]BBN84675.1 hypothetical protein MRSL_07150 [Staphylococcus lugdunensis]
MLSTLNKYCISLFSISKVNDLLNNSCPMIYIVDLFDSENFSQNGFTLISVFKCCLVLFLISAVSPTYTSNSFLVFLSFIMYTVGYLNKNFPSLDVSQYRTELLSFSIEYGMFSIFNKFPTISPISFISNVIFSYKFKEITPSFLNFNYKLKIYPVMLYKITVFNKSVTIL